MNKQISTDDCKCMHKLKKYLIILVVTSALFHISSLVSNSLIINKDLNDGMIHMIQKVALEINETAKSLQNSFILELIQDMTEFIGAELEIRFKKLQTQPYLVERPKKNSTFEFDTLPNNFIIIAQNNSRIDTLKNVIISVSFEIEKLDKRQILYFNQSSRIVHICFGLDPN